ncbi:MAG: PAS domain S-box protein [Bacteroidetes bacterium]|nr:PAS domain S-box protein [Bacteroidota bacterium]
MRKFDISVLYVEDDSVIREKFKKILIRKVKTLYVAENGLIGLKMYEDHKPDMILSDIKMPEMNGLEMIERIKKTNKDAKAIIMSAFSNPNYFLQAISIGVQGYLIKPVETRQLFKVMKEIAEKVLLEENIKGEEHKREHLEDTLKQSESVQKAVTYATEEFLRFDFSEDTFKKVLKNLGKATGASRISIFENKEVNKVLVTSQILEWTNKNIRPKIDNPYLQDFPYVKGGYKRWVELLKQDKPIYGLVKEFPVSEQEILRSQNIISIAVLPIFIHNKWWGFIVLDDCLKERIWTDTEIKTFSVAADIIGAAIHRNQVEKELLKLNDELEIRVEKRTKALQEQVNDRKLIEILLRESEEKYRQIFENANDGILLSVNGVVRFINPKLYEITGYLPKEAINRPFTDFVHPEYRDLVLQNHIGRLKGLDVPERYDIKAFNKKGEGKWYEVKSALITWEQSPAVLTFVADITQRKETANQLAELNQHLEKRVQEELKKIEVQRQLLIQKSKLESLGELAAGIAHEINQPLGGISMALDNMLIKIKDKSYTPKYLITKISQTFEDIDRIKTIIDHIRSFSRDQEKLEVSKVNVNNVIHNALSMLNTQYANHNINFILDLEETNNYIAGNQYRLEQVLLNLLSNAKHAVDQKKQELGESVSYNKRIQISSSSRDKNLIIVVEDNGVGISTKRMNKVFDPFYTTKEVEIGTGLGLSISYGLIKEMNGDIKVESNKDQFTIMTITLPKYKSKK